MMKCKLCGRKIPKPYVKHRKYCIICQKTTQRLREKIWKLKKRLEITKNTVRALEDTLLRK